MNIQATIKVADPKGALYSLYTVHDTSKARAIQSAQMVIATGKFAHLVSEGYTVDILV